MSEIAFDTDVNDRRLDWLLSYLPQASEVLDRIRSGVGNIHLSTARAIDQYFDDNYPHHGLMSLDISAEESRTSLTRRLLSDEYSVQVMAAYVRLLSDYRFGSEQKPLLESHADIEQWTLQDAVAIWHGYRYGVPDVLPGVDGFGFASVTHFQERDMAFKSFLGTVRGISATMNVTQAVVFFDVLLE